MCAVNRLKAEGTLAPITFILIDFLSESSVRAGAAEFKAQHGRLDMLVLNAGTGRGDPAKLWMANHVGPFLFTSILTSMLESTARATGDARIVAGCMCVRACLSVCLSSCVSQTVSPFSTLVDG